jgi:protein-S-isoprenylcysteine O-methyltransferase Ste14
MEFYMSNTAAVSRRLVRWFLINLFISAMICGVSGRFQDPWLWAYIATVAALSLYPTLALDPDLANERFRPPDAGADRLQLRIVRIIAVAHFVIALLDVRWQLSAVPNGVRLAGLIGMAISVLLVFRAMMTNRFFSAVIRIQKDRGHQVIDQGVYGIIRHPGYAGMIPSMTCSGLALGSWLGAALGLCYAAMMIRRVLFEDAFLRSQLQGYQEYAGRVRYRLIPRVW